MSFWKRTMDYLGLGPDDAYDDYDIEEEYEPAPRGRRQPEPEVRSGRGHRDDTGGEGVVRTMPNRPTFPSRDFDPSQARRPAGSRQRTAHAEKGDAVHDPAGGVEPDAFLVQVGVHLGVIAIARNGKDRRVVRPHGLDLLQDLLRQSRSVRPFALGDRQGHGLGLRPRGSVDTLFVSHRTRYEEHHGLGFFRHVGYFGHIPEPHGVSARHTHNERGNFCHAPEKRAGFDDVFDVAVGANIVTGASYTDSQNIDFQGIRTSITGTPAAGDVFTISAGQFEDVFSIVANLSETLKTNPGDTVRAANIGQSLADLDAAFEASLNARTQIGGRLNTLDSQRTENDAQILQTRSTLSTLRDTDLAQAISQLTLD